MADTPRAHQYFHAERDIYTAAGDIHVNLPGPSPEPKPGKIWGKVPARNKAFTGREPLLAAVHGAFASGARDGRAVVQALHGMGGVGKTQLAAEYAHRHADDYDVVWWLDSQDTALLGERFAALAAELSCADPGTPLDKMRSAVLTALRDRGRWLLVFDNAEKPEDINGWLPGGNGHVLITSRAHAWDEAAVPVEVDVLDRDESVAMLLGRRVPGLSEADAGKVAEALGDLPLALAQASAHMKASGMTASGYAEQVRTRAAKILSRGCPPSHPVSLAAVVQLAFDRLRESDPPSAQLAAICAFLAPDPVTAGWFPPAAAHLPAPLGMQAADEFDWWEVIARLHGVALARASAGTVLMHRLTQAVIREYLSSEESAQARGAAVKVLTTSRPGNEELPASWPAWAAALPHALALDPANSDDPDLRDLATSAVYYLFRRGDVHAAADLSRSLHDGWRGRLGEDHPDTLQAALARANALHGLGEHEEGRDILRDALEGARRLLGEDHPAVLFCTASAAVLLLRMGDLGSARDLCEDTLKRARGVVGEDDPAMLNVQSALAGILHASGETGAAREAYEATLARSREALGEGHSVTMLCAASLCSVLFELGDFEATRDLHEDTLARRRRELGEDHPATLSSQSNLAVTFAVLGELGAAREMHEDLLERYRQAPGEDHFQTLLCAMSLAGVLHGLGAFRAARDLSRDTLERCRRVLGEDDPRTLHCADVLVRALYRLRELGTARDLHEDTLARRRKVLGDDHPDTQLSARLLAEVVQASGEGQPVPGITRSPAFPLPIFPFSPGLSGTPIAGQPAVPGR